MPRKISVETALKRYQVQVKEIEALHKNSVVRMGVESAEIHFGKTIREHELEMIAKAKESI